MLMQVTQGLDANRGAFTILLGKDQLLGLPKIRQQLFVPKEEPKLTIIKVLQEVFLTGEVQLYFNVHGKCRNFPRFQGKLGDSIF